jgi:hypothetical protein
MRLRLLMSGSLSSLIKSYIAISPFHHFIKSRKLVFYDAAQWEYVSHSRFSLAFKDLSRMLRCIGMTSPGSGADLVKMAASSAEGGICKLRAHWGARVIKRAAAGFTFAGTGGRRLRKPAAARGGFSA